MSKAIAFNAFSFCLETVAYMLLGFRVRKLGRGRMGWMKCIACEFILLEILFYQAGRLSIISAAYMDQICLFVACSFVSH